MLFNHPSSKEPDRSLGGSDGVLLQLRVSKQEIRLKGKKLVSRAPRIRGLVSAVTEGLRNTRNNQVYR